MKGRVAVLALCAPLALFGQYIGNPAGKAFPLGALRRRIVVGRGYAGVEGGYLDLDLRSTYTTTAGRLKETSNLEEGYFAFCGGVHTHGFEIDAKVGGVFSELEEASLTADPFEDGAGVVLGTSARWGFSPVRGFRFGFGGQFTYTYSDGEAWVEDGLGGLYREDMNLETWRGQLFTGVAFDLYVNRDAIFSPYVGVGAEFIDGDLSIEHSHPWYWYQEKVGDVDEDEVPFAFAGLDVHIARHFRVGAEAKGNGAGWGLAATIGWSF